MSRNSKKVQSRHFLPTERQWRGGMHRSVSWRSQVASPNMVLLNVLLPLCRRIKKNSKLVVNWDTNPNVFPCTMAACYNPVWSSQSLLHTSRSSSPSHLGPPLWVYRPSPHTPLVEFQQCGIFSWTHSKSFSSKLQAGLRRLHWMNRNKQDKPDVNLSATKGYCWSSGCGV
jgi:hypothetical protein